MSRKCLFDIIITEKKADDHVKTSAVAALMVINSKPEIKTDLTPAIHDYSYAIAKGMLNFIA